MYVHVNYARTVCHRIEVNLLINYLMIKTCKVNLKIKTISIIKQKVPVWVGNSWYWHLLKTIVNPRVASVDNDFLVGVNFNCYSPKQTPFICCYSTSEYNQLAVDDMPFFLCYQYPVFFKSSVNKIPKLLFSKRVYLIMLRHSKK